MRTTRHLALVACLATLAIQAGAQSLSTFSNDKGTTGPITPTPTLLPTPSPSPSVTPTPSPVPMPGQPSELFNSSNPMDVEGSLLEFAPSTEGGMPSYTVCHQGFTGFAVDPNAGSTVVLGDDASSAYELANPVTFLGQSYSTIYINDNGNVSFGVRSSSYQATAASFFSAPRIAALLTDLDTGAGGTVTVQDLGDQVVVSWQNVPIISTTRTVQLQIQIFRDGRLRTLMLNDGNATSSYVGVSAGLGAPSPLPPGGLAETATCTGVGTPVPSPTPTPTPVFNAALSLDFEDDTAAAKFIVLNGAGDYATDFAYDYSTFAAQTGTVLSIPQSPNSLGNGTRALKLDVNHNDDIAAVDAVTLLPVDFPNVTRFTLKFDMWLNYNGGAAGGSGSTEYLMVGGHTVASPMFWPSGSGARGFLWAIDGEGGSSADLRYYASSGSGTPIRSDSTPNWRGVNAITTENTAWTSFFTAPPYETAGAPGKAWTTVEMVVFDRQVTVIMTPAEGVPTQVAQWTISQTGVTSGYPLIGYWDPFASIATPREDNFLLIDNLSISVAEIGGTATPTPTPTLTPTPSPTPPPGTVTDTDRDGLSDWLEGQVGLSPTNRDTDGDGFEDGAEGYGGMNPFSAAVPANRTDTDADGLPDSNDPFPNSPDGDGDGYKDSYEVARLTSPSDPASHPNLGDTDNNGQGDNVDAVLLMEFFLGTRPGPMPIPEQFDVNRDGVQDNVDALIIFNWFLGNIPYLPWP